MSDDVEYTISNASGVSPVIGLVMSAPQETSTGIEWGFTYEGPDASAAAVVGLNTFTEMVNGVAVGSLVADVATTSYYEPFSPLPAIEDTSTSDALPTIKGEFDAFPCFAEGTLIRTSSGDRPVESLSPGDLVLTAAGILRPIVWVGRRSVDLAAHPDPQLARPVIICAGAFAPNIPERDLVLSPDHNVAFDDVLIPAKCLVNAQTIIVDNERAFVTYHHIELETHDLVWADGLVVETFLDVGNRHALEPGASGDADFSSIVDMNWFRWQALGCARLVLTGPELVRARQVIEAQAKERVGLVTLEPT